MKYRHGKLKQVGGLTIQYNRYGSLISLRHRVNSHNLGCGFCRAISCSANHFDDRYASKYYDDCYNNGLAAVTIMTREEK